MFKRGRTLKLTAGTIMLDTEVPFDEQYFQDFAAGALECKNDSYAFEQSFIEMICIAGNMLATGLATEVQVASMRIFGLAVNYEEFSSHLLDLAVDFDKQECTCRVSDEAVGMYEAMIWLLNELSY